ncbi:MAG TPA: alpha/beta hydrolase [Limnobacter sp.]|uniref:alpha/beta fold hydrolase n=1 Tax=Limnobacter sp. TaxID=2003368 RepID=UPI002EDB2708
MSNALMRWICRSLIDSKVKKMGLRKVSVRTEDGRWVYFHGGQGPNLVLVHGFGANKENWLALAPKLMKKFTVWIPDLIGFGESDRPEGAPYNIEAQAERLRRWAAAVGMNDFHVMGNSMGGYLAGVLASDSQAMPIVKSACLLNPAGVKGAEHTAVGKAFAEENKVVLAPTNLAEFQWVMNLCFNNAAPPMPLFLQKYFAGIAVANKALQDRIFREFVNPETNPPLNELVAQARIPLMVVWGDSDQLVHSSGLAILKQANPSLVDVMLENTGHCPQADRARVVANAYEAFLAGV